VDDPTLGAAANGAGDMKNGALLTSAGNDEGLQRLQLLVALIDGVLQCFYPPIVDVRLGEMVVHFVEIGRGEESANTEEIALDGDENFIDSGERLNGARHPEDGVELIDIAVSLDPGVILLNAAAAEEAGVAGIAGFCVNLHARNLRFPEGWQTELQTELDPRSPTTPISVARDDRKTVRVAFTENANCRTLRQ